MSDADLTHTIHAAVARLAERVLDRYDTSPGHGFRVAPAVARDDADPELRRTFALGANAGWIVLTFACVVVMLVVGVPVKLLIGDSAGDVVLALCLVAAMSCVTGAFNVMWRMYWYVPQARRRALRDGPGSAGFATSMRRILPRNTSLILQAAAAAIALAVTL